LLQFRDRIIRRCGNGLLEFPNMSQLGNIRTVTGAADAGIQFEAISIKSSPINRVG
jgi:hypothetical protein